MNTNEHSLSLSLTLLISTARLIWFGLHSSTLKFTSPTAINHTHTHTLQYTVLELSLSLYSVLSTSGLIECQDWYDSTSPMWYTHTPPLHTCTHSNPVQRVEISFVYEITKLSEDTILGRMEFTALNVYTTLFDAKMT